MQGVVQGVRSNLLTVSTRTSACALTRRHFERLRQSRRQEGIGLNRRGDKTPILDNNLYQVPGSSYQVGLIHAGRYAGVCPILKTQEG